MMIDLAIKKFFSNFRDTRIFTIFENKVIIIFAPAGVRNSQSKTLHIKMRASGTIFFFFLQSFPFKSLKH